MATVTQLSSAAISTGTSLTFTGVSCIPDDVLIFISSSYSTFGFAGTSGYPMGSFSSNVITGSFPDLWGETGFGFQDTALTGNFVISFSSSAPAAGILFRIRPDAGKKLHYSGRYSDLQNAASTSRSITTTLYVAPGAILVGGYGVADDTYFQDTDTTNGSWSSVFYIPSTAGNDLAAFGQSKITTADGAQTYGGTFVNAQAEYGVGFLYVFFEYEIPYWGMRA